MERVLLGIILLIAYGKIGGSENTCFMNVHHYKLSNKNENQNECFVDIKCTKILFPDTEFSSILHDTLVYVNKTFTVINEVGECLFLDVTNTAIAVNGAGTNLTNIKIPLSWDMVHEVNVSHNNLTVIENYSFGSSYIKVLDLSYNYIENIEEEAFVNEDRTVISYIAILLLQHNKLRDLRYVRLSQESKLKVLDVSFNRIEDLSWLNSVRFSELHTIKADYNLITKLDSRIYMDDLKKLSLVGNSIRTIGSFFHLFSSLEMLDLSGNDIQNWEPVIFIGLHSLQYLNMSYNKIDTIIGEYFMHSLTLSVLDLSHNNLNKFALADSWSYAPINYLVINDNNLTEDEIFEVLKFPLKVHHICVGGNKLNCNNLILRQERERLRNNLTTHPRERDADTAVKIDCTNEDQLEEFEVQYLKPLMKPEERVIVPNYYIMVEDFKFMNSVETASSSMVVEVKLIRRAKPVMVNQLTGDSHEIVSHSDISVSTITCVSVLVVLVVLATSVGLIVWKFYPKGLHTWRMLRRT